MVSVYIVVFLFETETLYYKYLCKARKISDAQFPFRGSSLPINSVFLYDMGKLF